MVSLGNICRSPLAEGILKNKDNHLDITIDSPGTAGYHIGKPPDIRSIEIARKHNINLAEQRARQFNRQDFDNFDVIYAMDLNNYSHLIALSENQKEREKIKLILDEVYPNLKKSVPDPYYDEEEGFQKTYAILEKACNKIASKIE